MHAALRWVRLMLYQISPGVRTAFVAAVLSNRAAATLWLPSAPSIEVEATCAAPHGSARQLTPPVAGPVHV